MLIFPNSRTAVSTIRSTSEAFNTFVATASALPPALLMSRATSFANFLEIADPMPIPPPAVTIATLPSRTPIQFILRSSWEIAAAVDVDHHARNLARIRANQIKVGCCDLIRTHRARRQDLALRLSLFLVFLRRRWPARNHAAACNDPWGDDVDRDAKAAHFHGDGTRETSHGCLGGCVIGQAS